MGEGSITNLLSRLERLEREQAVTRQRFIWVETGVNRAEALRCAGALASDEVPVFVSWHEPY
jgi:hypothetical protein